MTRGKRLTWIEVIAATVALAAVFAVAIPAYSAWILERETASCRESRDGALEHYLAFCALFGNETTPFFEYALPAYGGADALCPEGGTVECLERGGERALYCSLHEPAGRVVIARYRANDMERLRRAARDVYALAGETVERAKAEHPGIAAGRYIDFTRTGASVVEVQGAPFDWSARIRAFVDDSAHRLTEGMVVLTVDPVRGLTVSHVFMKQGGVWIKYSPAAAVDSTMGAEEDALTAPAAG